MEFREKKKQDPRDGQHLTYPELFKKDCWTKKEPAETVRHFWKTLRMTSRRRWSFNHLAEETWFAHRTHGQTAVQEDLVERTIGGHHLNQSFLQAHPRMFSLDTVASFLRALNLTKRTTPPGDFMTSIRKRGQGGDTIVSKITSLSRITTMFLVR